MTRAFITAIDSFIGAVLASALRADGIAVQGTTRAQVDVTHRDAITTALRDAAPDLVFHLAARSNVTQSVHDPVPTFATNVLGSLHVFEAVRAHAPTARVISIGSSAEYGDAARPAPALLREDAAVAPRSPYGASKAAQGQLTRIYARTHNLHMVHVRPFAVIGPGKRGDALSDFCRDVVQLEQAAIPAKLAVGTTTAVRDFVDVADCVAALRLVAERGTAGETYNICHGIGTTIGELLEHLRAASRVAFAITPDPARARPVDDPYLVGDPGKLVDLGFVRRRTLEETVATTLAAWRTA